MIGIFVFYFLSEVFIFYIEKFIYFFIFCFVVILIEIIVCQLNCCIEDRLLVGCRVYVNVFRCFFDSLVVGEYILCFVVKCVQFLSFDKLIEFMIWFFLFLIYYSLICFCCCVGVKVYKLEFIFSGIILYYFEFLKYFFFSNFFNEIVCQ